jgi:hypothetical protein
VNKIEVNSFSRCARFARGHTTALRFPRGMASPESLFHPNLGATLTQRVGREGEWGCSIRASLAFAMYEPRGFYRPTAVCGACQTPDHATAVTAPSRPATAEAVAGFDPREALAGYRSPSRGLVLLPPWSFSRRPRRAFAEMTGSPQRGYVESVQRACRERRNRSSQRARRSLSP